MSVTLGTHALPCKHCKQVKGEVLAERRDVRVEDVKHQEPSQLPETGDGKTDHRKESQGEGMCVQQSASLLQQMSMLRGN